MLVHSKIYNPSVLHFSTIFHKGVRILKGVAHSGFKIFSHFREDAQDRSHNALQHSAICCNTFQDQITFFLFFLNRQHHFYAKKRLPKNGSAQLPSTAHTSTQLLDLSSSLVLGLGILFGLGQSFVRLESVGYFPQLPPWTIYPN